jgi:signal transduction histidine kinase
MMKGDRAIGTINVARFEVRPFTDTQVELLKTFADQAVIAIENVRLFNETREALEQQTATAETLGVVARSQADLRAVFEAIGRNAAQLCSAMFSCVYRFDGELIHLVAIHNLPPAAQELARTMYPMKPDRSQLAGRAVLTRTIQRLEDVAQDGEYAKQVAVAGAWRRFLAVPMLREGKPLGVIGIGWPDPGAIPERQVELLKTFADQAVIAIENARLFNETKEALEQQTATAEILGVISGSPTDTRPVFEAIVQSGLKLFSDAAISVALPHGGEIRAAAVAESDPARAAAWRGRFPFSLTREYMHGVAILDRRVVDLPDVRDAPPEMAAGSRNFLASGYRAITIMPMMHGEEAIGALSVVRLAPGPLSAKQLAVLKTFADQAVIAIENVRLFNETKEALEQQKASSEVLQAISSSIADTTPVFDKILESCQRLFAGTIVGLNLVREDGALHIGAYHGAHREEFERIFPIPLTIESGSGLAILERRAVNYPDTQGAEVPERTRKGCKAIGINSVIFAPVLWEGRGVGAIFVGRDRLSSFSDREISLLQTFGDQAAIAIENARLFKEIQDKSRQLEVASRHKSEFLANMSHELRTPLNAIIGFTRIVIRRSKEALEPQQHENLEKILASGQHLLALINSILDLAKIEAGRVDVNPSHVGLAPLLEQCARTIEPLVKADAVRLEKDFNGALPEMFVDEEKLRQIVINLLSNAAKFTERGTIRLCAEAANGVVSIAVADTGIGIAEDKLEVIFEEFEQADASSTRVYGGTGLGLAIARRLARTLGGDVKARSRPGAGSTFTLTLPARYAA